MYFGKQNVRLPSDVGIGNSSRGSGTKQTTASKCPVGSQISIFRSPDEEPIIGYVVINDKLDKVGYSTRVIWNEEVETRLVGEEITVGKLHGIYVAPHKIALTIDSEGNHLIRYLERSHIVYITI